MGLGRFGGGRGVTEFLCRQGAEVTVTDLESAESLAPTLASMRDLPVHWALGGHREDDFVHADLVVPSPAVPRDAALLDLCRRRGVPLESEMNLFFKYCRGRICAVTGSNGKTTTTRLLGAMASRRWSGLRVGGNLGVSLLPEVESIRAADWVILELSSFQLEDLRALPRRPEVCVVTNLSPNHLDRHGTYEAYIDAKRQIVGPGPPPDTAVLCAEDARLRSWAARCGRRPVYFGRTGCVVPRAPGVWIDEERGEVFWSSSGERRLVFEVADLRLRGRFNLLNAAAAAASAVLLGVEAPDILAAVRDFLPVEHRLELFLERSGVEYFDDSIATTPESTIAALETLGPRVLLISGGATKGCAFTSLAETIRRRARAVFLIGETAGDIEAACRSFRPCPPLFLSGTLERALAAVREVAQAGDRVVLSPACPSYDQFPSFRERGLAFKALVARVTR